MSKELKWTGERMVTGLTNFVGIYEHLHRYAIALQYVKGKAVLDIASGEGYGSNIIATYAESVVGVDISEETIDHAKEKYFNKKNLTFKVGSADNIPLADSSIDVIISFETIEHHDRHNEMFQEIIRVLKPDGILIISSPEKSIYKEIDPNNPFHIKELTLDELKYLVNQYFDHSRFFYQKFFSGSIILNQDPTNAKIQEYEGGFDSIKVSDQITKAYFNICIAANREVDDFNITFFDASEIYQSAIESVSQKYITSTSYRLGSLILYPLKRLKVFFKW